MDWEPLLVVRAGPDIGQRIPNFPSGEMALMGLPVARIDALLDALNLPKDGNLAVKKAQLRAEACWETGTWLSKRPESGIYVTLIRCCFIAQKKKSSLCLLLCFCRKENVVHLFAAVLFSFRRKGRDVFFLQSYSYGVFLRDSILSRTIKISNILWKSSD